MDASAVQPVDVSRSICVLWGKHREYLLSGLRGLSSSYVSLDASRPWLIYWIMHSLELLKVDLSPHIPETVATLKAFQNPGGGFGGNVGQLSHLAPTYAAVMALAICGEVESVRREPLYRWFMSLKHESGGFRMHRDGEIDARGTYTVLACAKILNLLTNQLAEGAASFLLKCQTYEGGFGGEPGNEAHGGYCYCAVAALDILGELDKCNMNSLKAWIARRQMSYEGGYQGRANKLVDGCYSFWQAGAMAIVDRWECKKGDGGGGRARISCGSDKELCVDREALQRYILLCAQSLDGGLRDKPSKSRDYYHTCYNLSGLAVAQHFMTGNPGEASIWGHPSNELERTSETFNIVEDKVDKAIDSCKGKVCEHDELMAKER